MSDGWLLILLMGGAFASVLMLVAPFVQTAGMNSRLKAVARRREDLRQKQREGFQRTSKLRKQQAGWMKAIVDKLKLRERLANALAREQLMQAGWRGQAAVVTFAFMRIAMPPVVGLLVFLSVSGPLFELGFLQALLAAAVASAVGFYLPNILVKNQIQRRQKTIMMGFPNSLDLLLICVESGLSMEAAFARVAQEMGDSYPDIAEEFGIATAELAFLPDRRQALDNLALRTGLPQVKSVTTSLIQADRYGTPLAATLKVLSQESRDSRMAAAEKKAAALPAKLTVPMMVFFVPVLFLVIIGPTILSFTT